MNMKEFEELHAMFDLQVALEEGEKSAREEDWLSAEEIELELIS